MCGGEGEERGEGEIKLGYEEWREGKRGRGGRCG